MVYFMEILYVDDCMVCYEGDNVDELKKDFHCCVDDYLDSCKRKNIKPIKSCKCSFDIRTLQFYI